MYRAMKIFSAVAEITERFALPILTMGNFDGVHFGHQYIFRLVKERARYVGGTAMVLTFDPHPQRVLAPRKEFFLINHIEEKINIIRKIGIDVLICLPFTKEFAARDPKEFVRSTLVDMLHVNEIYVGYNSRFGRQQTGTPEILSTWGEEFGFRVTIVPPVRSHGHIVSSTKIRQLLREGIVEEAAKLLNRPYAVDGKVVPGANRGSTILGYPTANIDVQHELIPKKGVYIGRVIWKGREFPAVANIGTNPTFQQGKEISVEVHLLDFHENLYAEHITVIFLKRLRDELTFSHYQDLIAQITQDVRVAEAYFRDYDS